MTIVPMKRIALIAPAADKEAVLAALQALGCLHLVPLREAEPLAPPDSASRRRARVALRHITGLPSPPRPWPRDDAFDHDGTIEAILANKDRLRTLAERRHFLAHRIADLEPWGDFDLPPLDAVAGFRLWFYVLPGKDARRLERLDLPWQIVRRDQTRLYIAVVAREEPPPDLLGVPRIHTGARRLMRLRQDLENVEVEIEVAETERRSLSRYRVLLGLRLAAAEDADDRLAAAAMTLDADPVFALSGWAPTPALGGLERLAADRGLALVAEDPAPDDRPPTLLEEGNRAAAGADLTRFYMTPAYRSWDPGLIVFASFAVFFAMILADAGYAVLLGLALAIGWRRAGRSVVGRRLRVLGAVLVGAAFAYGVLAGSWFGIAPRPDGLLDRLAVIDVEDFDAMMRVSVIVGALHLSLANGVVAWRNRGTGLAVARLGWIAATAGGLVAWLAPGEGLGAALIAGGLAAVFWGSGSDHGTTGAARWLRRGIDGVLGLARVTRMFGDVLSYLRLFALGLASASLAATFNSLAADLQGGTPGVGFLLAGLLLVFGHAINLALAVMSGVVHGLRLNFIEFFGWGLTDEGYPFKAFARRETPT